ncbi:glycosyltransferase family 4 protein [Pseudonocardia nigra]|uniref:glycosyltransferase family 4 protein n=1 Tax=Pseudonocardia nigra TaxID=1921578 RepID=UPI0027E2E857|nr:glycosyltransferase family 4 protein [Pseudonocardia nigra]
MSSEAPRPDVCRGGDDLVVALTYYAPYVSGLTNMARDIAEGLAARGRRVMVVTSRFDPSLPLKEEINGVRVLRAPVLLRLGRGVVSPEFVRLARATIERAKVGALQLPMLEAGAIAAGMHTPLVSTYHCDVTLPPGLVNTAQRLVVDASNRAAMRRSAVVAVTSEDYARHSRMWSAIEPSMAVVPPPCPPSPPGRPTYRETDGLHVGFLGRIVREKGLEYLVRGFRALPDPDARLLIGGDFTHVAGGSAIEQVRAAIGDDDRIRLMGFVPEERIGDFYASLDVFTLPSVNAFEAFGIVQAVAMLAGVPVLSSDIPGVRQPVAQTGFGRVVPHADAGAITRALQAMQADPPDREAGAARAHEAFSVAAVLDGYEVLLDKAVHHQGSAK